MKQKFQDCVDWGLFWSQQLNGCRLVKSRDTFRADSPFTGRHKSKPFVAQGPVWYDHSILDGSERGGSAISFLMKLHCLTYRQALRRLLEFSLPGGTSVSLPWKKNSPLMNQANPTWFIYREIVEGGLYNRISLSRFKAFRQTPDYYGDPSAVDCFYSHYLHSTELLAYVTKSGGKVAGYTGPVDLKHPTIDIDYSENLNKAQEIACRVYNQLIEFGIPRYHIHPFFSGNKGFHIMFYTPELKKLGRYQNTPCLIRNFVKKITEPVVPDSDNTYLDKQGRSHKIIDDAIYSCTSLVRSPNSRHGSSGLYKIPLSEPELMSLSIEAIKDLARTQRPIGLRLSQERSAA
ncbi:MAG TPA: DNA primase small subunit domain-containing protein [Chitinivibrionales bacterium]|nr:DNA primase small subunit domain-containing protein [Chitinivibrionales bacterium]